ncbi:MAG TPA: S8 family serine peptidase [Cyclobacteriaceae bacterium]
MRFFALFIVLFLSTYCFGQQADNLKTLSEQIEKVSRERNQRINAFLKKGRQSKSFVSTEGNQYLLVDIDSNGNPIYRSTLNANAAITTGASKLQSGAIGLLLEGKNLTLGVWDGGKIQTHIELEDRVISNEEVSISDHATHVTGILIASGVNAAAKGMAPKAKIIAKYYDNDHAEMASLARPDQTSLLISNHSYGQVTGWYRMNNSWEWAGDPSISQDEDFRFGFYGDRAQVNDQIAYLSPYYSIVWAAGNDRAETGNGTHPPDCNNGTGYDCIIPDGVAKNIITVGATDKILNYTGPGSVPMSYFSSWGPTDDGRIKPDLIGDGVNLFSLSSSGTNQYEMNSGTSMATPNVAGSLTLLQELYSKLHGGNVMKAATLKAIAIHTAKEAGIFPGPDYSFGWGLLDVEVGANVLLHEDGINTMIKELTLNNGETINLSLSPQANQKIKASIVWTDPAGSPVADKLDPTNSMLVNDLDIKLVDDLGNEILPWVLDPGNPSKGATKGINIRDNVEKIEFDLPIAKPYRLIVSHKGKLINDKQDFSLIVTYQSSANAAQTYYWIGDSGAWSDPTHWSNVSGGTTLNKVPTSADYVIVDENSFDGLGMDQINFSQDQSAASLLWVNSKPSGINFNNKNLLISRSLTIASSAFQINSAGHILLSTLSDGNVSFSGNELGMLDLKVVAGNWEWVGDVTLGKVTLDAGSLKIADADVKFKNLISNSTSLRELTVTNSSIELTEGSLISQPNLTLDVSNAVIVTSGAQVILDWSGLGWNGGLVVANGKLVIKGNNVIDSLVINAGAEMVLTSGTEQKINTIEIMSTALTPVKINSDGNASINLLNHKKICLDFLEVANVEAKGVGVMNAGENSVLTNAKGWSSQKCDDVLFADFEVKYPCQNAWTAFTDKSQGDVQQWEWTFPESIHVAEEANFSFPEARTYQVTLKVSDGKTSHSYTGNVIISANSLATNEVLLNSDEMYSFNLATSYQWLRNGEIISSETERHYNYEGQDGTYSVVTYDGECNRLSDPLTITGLLEEPTSLVQVYPNPSNTEVVIESKKEEINFVIITDLLGKRLVEIKPNQQKVLIPVSQFSDGIYVVEMTIGKVKYRDKIMVKH